MQYEEFAPPPALRDLVICFWSLQHDYTLGDHSHEELWADTHVELIMMKGEPYFIQSHDTHRLPADILIGPSQKNLKLYANGLTSFIAIRFYPWAIPAFFKKDVRAIIDRIVPAQDFLGHETVGELRRLLSTAMTTSEKITRLAKHLEGLNSSISHSTTFSQPIGLAIIQQKGLVTISELTKEFNRSGRQIQRLFKQGTGLSLKAFAKITRFNQAKALIEDDPFVSLAQLAAETGYADQAHFTKHFKALFGITPAVYKARWQKLHAEFATP